MQPSHDQDAPEQSNKLSFADMGRRGWSHRPLVPYTCQHCGKEKQTKVPNVAKWCSNSCNWKAHRDKGMYDRQAKCSMCGVDFTARPNQGKRYRESCSAACRAMIVGKKNAKLSIEAVGSIRAYGAEGKSQRQIAEMFKISQNVVSQILRGKSFQWVPGGVSVQSEPEVEAEPAVLPENAQAI
jgi:hypothetical protein